MSNKSVKEDLLPEMMRCLFEKVKKAFGHHLYIIENDGLPFVQCTCGATGPISANKDNARENWNTRTPSKDKCSYTDKYKAIKRPTCGCTACYEKYIDKLESRTPSKSEWVSVEDRLPNRTKQVEVVFYVDRLDWKTGIFTPKGFDGEEFDNFSEYDKETEHYKEVIGVKYWMSLEPLPHPPEKGW